MSVMRTLGINRRSRTVEAVFSSPVRQARISFSVVKVK